MTTAKENGDVEKAAGLALGQQDDCFVHHQELDGVKATVHAPAPNYLHRSQTAI